MSKQLSAQDIFGLSKAFHELSVTIGKYRYDHWDELTPAQRTDMEAKQWTLFNTSSDLNAQSVVLKVQLVENDLKALQLCAKAMTEAADKIADVKHAISIVTKAVAFGGTLYLAASTGNVGALIAAASALVTEIGA